jgi:hypothetical protein
VPIEAYQQNDFLKFSLLADPEDNDQTKEWGRFMCFLRERKKVNIILLIIDMEDTNMLHVISSNHPSKKKTVGELGSHLVIVL